MSTPIESLGLVHRTRDALLSRGIDTIEKLVEILSDGGFKMLLIIPNVGKQASADVAERLALHLIKQAGNQAQKLITSDEIKLRDDFAAKAMQCYLTHGQAANSPEDVVAGWAYSMADAMLRARGDK